ncbi:MAG: hypothetical protein KUA35_15130 [Pseudodesulfovibrio sp.]|uniref:Uncharacterized protein n=1 Tax=Pseudodesulfovibrio aespoeensis (strain ATCC 700646 / DSM 10631 / Aspo-2) TaxID=643562 RepID=E6VUK6_PSEA9|nr:MULTISPECIES: hypothetical protein [Pseudodesulfovibrio]MBU4192902.1 hypothetical protein [Pseudomonadota bacterium]ADU61151.1 hypothetical protein Daes_0124 [Pseudodesulfovibrio aespoeensis Aspo-2]MBU4378757.1 hypothetical protein [Pseudomonadota bacterium]MBU4475794.1 hypothetical protein [Pseudomonadota bacterium]MBU4517415.1 hypothetical protein [Pseudomonadota bacterium]
MRNTKIILLNAALLVLLACATAWAANVAQGACVSYDADKKILVIEEYDLNFTPEHKYGQPTGTMIEFDTTTAKIGILPEPGDVLRLSYVPSEKKNTALKVMNVSKQDLMKK